MTTNQKRMFFWPNSGTTQTTEEKRAPTRSSTGRTLGVPFEPAAAEHTQLAIFADDSKLACFTARGQFRESAHQDLAHNASRIAVDDRFTVTVERALVWPSSMSWLQ